VRQHIEAKLKVEVIEGKMTKLPAVSFIDWLGLGVRWTVGLLPYFFPSRARDRVHLSELLSNQLRRNMTLVENLGQLQHVQKEAI